LKEALVSGITKLAPMVYALEILIKNADFHAEFKYEK